ncbi:MAG: magnesium transporter [Deltaproteobacteria bacterium]|nr:magnesium transporter [Deltaproteobacteria bacterium]
MNQRNIQVFHDTMARLLHRGAQKNLSNIIEKSHFADLAQVLRMMDNVRDQRAIFHLAAVEKKAQILGELEKQQALNLLEEMPYDDIVKIFQHMSSKDVTDIIGSLPDDVSKELLKLMEPKGSQVVEELLKYPQDSAGGIMSTEFCALDRQTTVAQTIHKFQSEGDLDNIFYVYVINQVGQLVGVLSLRKLLQVKPETKIEDIMISDVIRVKADTDQEEVAKMVQSYNLLALPVVDESNKLIGIITVDDIVDVIRDEAQEDLLKMGGVGDVEISEKSSFKSARSRLPWLFISLIGGLIVFKLMVLFKTVISESVALVFFIPLIMGMTGNVATQASTIVVSGLASGKLGMQKMGWIVWKELKVGLIFGLIYGVMVGVFANLQLGVSFNHVGLMVGGALGASIVLGSVMGTLLPFVFERTRIDPAFSTGPFVITVVDIFGVAVYLYVAHLMYAAS